MSNASLLGPDLGVEHDLEEEVAQLLDEGAGVAPIDGLQDLVRFLDEEGLQRRAGLLHGPRDSPGGFGGAP